MLDFEQFALLGAVLVGVTELINRIRAQDYWTVVTILTCVLIGALFGLSGYFPGLDVVKGIVYAFGASGALKALQSLGNKSLVAPSEPVVRK